MSIHLHAETGDIAALITDIDGGVAVDARDEQGRTPLMIAAVSPNATAMTIRMLLDRGADANAITLPTNPVTLDDATRKTMEELGMDTSLYDTSSASPCVDSVLSYAIQNGATTEKLRLLIEAGANAKFINASGYSALTYAVYRTRRGSDHEWNDILSLLIAYGAPLDTQSRHGESPISVASMLGNFDLVNWLLERGADSTPLRWTPLFYEIAKGNAIGVTNLLDKGAQLDERDARSRTPFLLAVHAGRQQIAEMLLSRGSDLSAKGRCGSTALMHAISQDDVAMLKWLISAGCDIEECDDFGTNPLLEAARTGAPKCVQALLDAGATPECRTEHGSTPISEAASPEIALMLVRAGQDLGDVGSAMRMELLKASACDEATEQQYGLHKHRIFGQQNPERMNNPLWDWLVVNRVSAYECASKYGDARGAADPVWCFQRFGQSLTELPDGRYVEIGGEHEDFYDPDFCIYNDLVVHENGRFQICGYPQDVFPPTDFHSATLLWPYIYIIGNLGYQHERRPGDTSIYRVDCNSWKIERVMSRGDAPGWIHGHKARPVAPDRIALFGGQIVDGADGDLIENTCDYELNLSDFRWTRLR